MTQIRNVVLCFFDVGAKVQNPQARCSTLRVRQRLDLGQHRAPTLSPVLMVYSIFEIFSLGLTTMGVLPFPKRLQRTRDDSRLKHEEDGVSATDDGRYHPKLVNDGREG